MLHVKLLKDVAEGNVELVYEDRLGADGKPELGPDKKPLRVAKRDATGKRPSIKTTSKPNPNWFPPQEVEGKDGKTIIESKEPRFLVTEFVAGTIVTMHEASAAKWVKLGLCEIVAAPKAEALPPA